MTDHEYDAEFAAWLANDPEVETHVIRREPVRGEHVVTAVWWGAMMLGAGLFAALIIHAVWRIYA